MLEKYLKAQYDNPQTVLIIRIGDFYEVVGDQAPRVARILGLTLRMRGNHPMVGWPCHQDVRERAKLALRGVCHKLYTPEQSHG